MKRLDSIDVCMYIIYALIPVAIIAAIMMIISFIGLRCQNDCFIDQNEYSVVINKDSRLTPQVIGKFISTRRVNRINAVGLTTQDTVTIDVDRYIFDDIKIGDTIKTIKLRK